MRNLLIFGKRSADTEVVQPTLTEWLTVAVIGGMVIAVVLRLLML